MWFERPRDYYRRVETRFRGGTILEVGCGKKKLPGALGIDVRSSGSADVAHDLDQLPWPFEDSSFDLVLISHCLEHLKDVVATLEELWRVTRPQGTIGMEAPHFSWCDLFKWIGFETMANWFSHLYERHFAFIFPAGSIVWKLEAVKDLPKVFSKTE